MDGWRLDVVHMLGEEGGARNNLRHIAGITQAAKLERPDAFVFGEHFGDARQWLQADVEDSAMNYRGFTFPLWGFLANTDISYDPQKIDAQTCMAWMDNYRAGLSHQQQLRMFNQLDSHDTARFKSLLGKDVRACRWRWCGYLAGRACRAFTTAMKWAWTAITIRSAVSRSRGIRLCRMALCSNCTSG
jgi:alpha-glucosidase